MDDAELVRKLHRVPSVELALIRGVIAFLEARREDPPMPLAEEMELLERVERLMSDASEALVRLGWRGEQEMKDSLPDGGVPEAFAQLTIIGVSALTARGRIERASRTGRPVGALTHAVHMLAELIERGGGKVDATQGGELCQAFGVVIEAAGLSIANQRETVRAALKRRGANQ